MSSNKVINRWLFHFYEESQRVDPYRGFKENKANHIMSALHKEIAFCLKTNPSVIYTEEEAVKMSLYLLIERMLGFMYRENNKSFKAMISSNFFYMSDKSCEMISEDFIKRNMNNVWLNCFFNDDPSRDEYVKFKRDIVDNAIEYAILCIKSELMAGASNKLTEDESRLLAIEFIMGFLINKLLKKERVAFFLYPLSLSCQ